MPSVPEPAGGAEALAEPREDWRLLAGGVAAVVLAAFAVYWPALRGQFLWDDVLIDTIAARCTETSSGARNVEKILSRTLLPELSAEVLSRLAEGNAIDSISVGVDTAGSFQYAIN